MTKENHMDFGDLHLKLGAYFSATLLNANVLLINSGLL